MAEIEKFETERQQNIRLQGDNAEMSKLGMDFMLKTAPTKY